MKSWMKKNWGMACLLGAVVLLCITGSLAAYTNFSYARRVVAAKTENRTLFSSNLLYTEDKTTESGLYRTKKITLSQNNSFLIEIYNYQLGDTKTYNNQTITYTLQCTLLASGDSVSGYSIQSGETTYSFSAQDGNYVATIKNQTLERNVLSVNRFVFNVPEADRDKMKLCIEAIPEETSYNATNSKKLAAVILTGEMTVEKNWTGRLLDSQDGRSPNQYDGFNYEISGNGQGTVTLSWDTSVLKISPWFEGDTGGTLNTVDGWASIEFSVGGDDQPLSYQTQFYWIGKPQNIDWQPLSQKIKVSFTESAD